MLMRVVVGLLVSRRRVGALSDSTVGLVPRVPSRMCWVEVLCRGISFLGLPRCRRRIVRRRRGEALLASRTPRASGAFVGERRR